MSTVMCPHCRTDMRPGGGAYWQCTTCPRIAQSGETPEAIDEREAARQAALSLLDAALAHTDEQRKHDRTITDEMEARMGQMIQTRGCGRCGGTMYKTVETDDNGNPTSETQFVCGGCGNVE